MAWIKFEVDTSDKPEVWAMAQSLNADPDAVVGKLLRVWGWFDAHTEDGNAPSVTKTLLDRRVGVTGFCDAMVSVGWMLEQGGVISLPNFARHNGKTAKNRALTAKRVAKHKQETNADSNGQVTPDALPREDKKREDIRPPLPPKGGKSPLISLKTFLEQCKEKGEKAIPETDPIFDYAEEIGVPGEYLELAWQVFRDEYLSRDKRYRDWRAHFRTYIRKNYHKLWWIQPDGTFALTTTGKQAERVHRKGVAHG